MSNIELEKLFNNTIKSTPEFTYCPEYDPKGYENIKALWFKGPKYGSKETKVFAYIGFPKLEGKVPGVVLVHGGGGYAFPEWIKMWNDRGYAAIAMANTGYWPGDTNITNFYASESWTHEVDDSFGDYVLPPDNDAMNTSVLPINQQWMYHGVSQTIIANNILRLDERVDGNKVGVTGISWGGVITSIAIGYDNRFAFAIPVYGSGYLYESHAWIKDNFNTPGTKELWDPANRLNMATMPVLWLCWADDNCFSINSNDKSFADTPKGAMCIKQAMGHGHIEGFIQPEIFRFADSVVKGKEPLVTCVTQPKADTRDISFEINIPRDCNTVTGKVYYIISPLSYSPNGRLGYDWCDTIDNEWHSVDCNVKDNVVYANLPEDVYSYYVEITAVCSGEEYKSCTRFVTIK